MPQLSKFKTLLLSAMVIVLAATGCKKSLTDDALEITTDNEVVGFSTTPIQDQYIVVYNEDYSQNVVGSNKTAVSAEAMEQLFEATALDVLAENNIEKGALKQSFSATIKGMVVNISADQATNLKRDNRISYVEQDQMIILNNGKGGGNGGGNGGKKDKTTPPDDGGGGDGGGGDTSTVTDPTPVPSTQVTPWGVNRVGFANFTGKRAWVLDTGIDLDHPDLNVDLTRSKSFVTTGLNPTTADDLHGHGTHVAGTIAAINNTYGVVGVAAGAPVVAVRVLDENGSGSISGVINGVNYISTYATAGDVANMSLGGGASQALDDAVLAASNKGIYFAVAAGNSGANAIYYSPARVNGPYVYTISAMNSSDYWASFSNWGTPVDYCAPGVSIYSTARGGGYTTMSGTSMATPHVAGLLLITNGSVKTGGYVIGDPDGSADRISVK